MIGNKSKHIIGGFLTVLAVSYFLCLTFCTHTHIINSRLVTHAHPYKSPSHTHTGTEISLFSALSTFNAIELDFSVNIEPVLTLLSEIVLAVFLKVEKKSSGCLSLRAPPAF